MTVYKTCYIYSYYQQESYSYSLIRDIQTKEILKYYFLNCPVIITSVIRNIYLSLVFVNMNFLSFLFINFSFLLFVFNYIYNHSYKTKLRYRKSQYNQDLSLYYNYFQETEKGFFIEIGAHDGISMSNTFFFERNFNWKGILIEGGEKNCERLTRNSIYRNNAIIICSPICKTKYINYKEAGLLGSIIHNNNTNHLRKCNTLKNVTNYYNIKKIDLFSLDVEGSELEVLQTFNFDITVSCWMIEWNHLSKEKKVEIEKLLNDNGYYIDRKYISPIDIVFKKKY